MLASTLLSCEELAWHRWMNDTHTLTCTESIEMEVCYATGVAGVLLELIEMEADIHNPSHVNSYLVDGMHDTSIVEWSKKRKSKNDIFDLHRPKHKCWVNNTLAEEESRMFHEDPLLGSMQIHLFEGGTESTDPTSLDDHSDLESAKDSNSLMEDYNTCMSRNEGSRVEAESANFYADLYALKNVEEHSLLGLGSQKTDQMYSEISDGIVEKSVDKEFVDNLYSEGEDPFILSSGIWSVEQEAQSSTRPPTIDQEFEQYFSMLML
ncbi:hypothetical protein PIB30_022646 [Stylosanthes scabra]|uniref:Far-red elongated hypocotyl 1 n=1 Tax=Stylosanthes scabra TaxID=79078 RepID=A0ABU6T910_9FABA|nr:hypothetical protein [Stylosanthes scabra]